MKEMHQSSLFDNDYQSSVNKEVKELEVIRPELPDGEVLYFPHFLDAQSADDYLQTLRESLQWRQDQIVIYGRSVNIPRLQAWYGDSEAQYSYSGIDMMPKPWTRELLALKSVCEDQLTCQFNSVLANWYRDGNDSMGFHSDDEPELGGYPVIAALSFGQNRTLKFRHKNRKNIVSLPLQHGSLLVMKGATQRFWQHGISKSKRALSDRISLTFRKILSDTTPQK